MTRLLVVLVLFLPSLARAQAVDEQQAPYKSLPSAQAPQKFMPTPMAPAKVPAYAPQAYATPQQAYAPQAYCAPQAQAAHYEQTCQQQGRCGKGRQKVKEKITFKRIFKRRG